MTMQMGFGNLSKFGVKYRFGAWALLDKQAIK